MSRRQRAKDILKDQKFPVETRYILSKRESLLESRGASSENREIASVVNKTLEEASAEEVKAFILAIQERGPSLLMAIGSFWVEDWSREEKEAWVNFALAKARTADWPQPGLSAGPVWTVRGKKAREFHHRWKSVFGICEDNPPNT